ncbi:WXG100 family type VII secretion target [Candidatus Chloroploca sp. M-50]|uniref:WXG100 family type VII secretion target n=1 Tax=Candidatus Chloroploca mongolica TaxID=2528176 RepID=A0ABS4DD99_9CHLR|nr:WXG100 family type VII secretion target [Candidatus Chloroploca mongolica]MBP1467294.1 WXG100 family type VII secretion target [Candidatus Chloroploca mongolica]
MPGIIRADTDQLRAVANQMRTTAEQISTGTGSMQQSMEMLDMVWSGKARDRGMEAWTRIVARYNPEVNTLLHLAKELEALAQRMDEAAAVFGDSGSGIGGGEKVSRDEKVSTAQELPTDAPKNMFDMYKKIRGEPEIKIFRIGDNEFVITLEGTQSDGTLGGAGIFGGAGWGNAIAAQQGKDTAYSHLLEKALRSLPDGADVHLFGYSQGGIVAQNLAYKQDFLSHHDINLKSISTFGTPEPIYGEVEGITYKHFDSSDDLIGKIGKPISKTPESELTVIISAIDKTVTNNAHGSYGNKESDIAKKMQDVDEQKTGQLPFKIEQWERYDNNEFDTNSLTLNDLGNIASRGLQEGMQNAKESFDNTLEAANEQLQKIEEAANEQLQRGKQTLETAFSNLDPRNLAFLPGRKAG